MPFRAISGQAAGPDPPSSKKLGVFSIKKAFNIISGIREETWHEDTRVVQEAY